MAGSHGFPAAGERNEPPTCRVAVFQTPDGKALVKVLPIGSDTQHCIDPVQYRRRQPQVQREVSTPAADGGLLKAMKHELSPPEMAVAQVEGWILGVPWEPTKKAKPTAKPTEKAGRAISDGKTTKAGYVTKNGHEVLQATDLPVNDRNQVVYVLRCRSSGYCFGANGSDIWQRKCPACGGGAVRLAC
jgi:hypothetical protein